MWEEVVCHTPGRAWRWSLATRMRPEGDAEVLHGGGGSLDSSGAGYVCRKTHPSTGGSWVLQLSSSFFCYKEHQRSECYIPKHYSDVAARLTRSLELTDSKAYRLQGSQTLELTDSKAHNL